MSSRFSLRRSPNAPDQIGFSQHARGAEVALAFVLVAPAFLSSAAPAPPSMLRVVAASSETNVVSANDAAVTPIAPVGRVLRVTADPNNLPFSNDRLEGFENRIAELISRDLRVEIKYTWRAQRRGFFRETLKDNTADLILGVPAGFERALTTRPYYRSTYAFVFGKEKALRFASFDDTRLRSLRIGVHLIGDDGANTPPAHALAMRGIITNVVGFSIYGDYRQQNPPARIIDALARGDIDLAVVWGPFAGYFAPREPVPLAIVPVPASAETQQLPFQYSIALGVRKSDKLLRDDLDAFLVRRQPEINDILKTYNVPLVRPAS